MNTSPWYQQYSEQLWVDWYRKEFRNKFAKGLDDPDDACANVIEKLLVTTLPNAKLKHLANLDAFVKAAFRNLAKDYKRKAIGRLRAPSAMVNLGEPFPQIFFEYCLNKLRANIIAEKLLLPLQSVKDWVEWLNAEKKCPEKITHLSMSDESTEELIQTSESYAQDASESLTKELDQERRSIIAHWLFSHSVVGENPIQNKDQLIDSLSTLPELPLDHDDRILLKMLYWEGLSISTAAKTLNIERYKVRNHRNSVLKKLRHFFIQHDIEF